MAGINEAASSLDHLVGPREEGFGDRQPKRLRRLKVYDKIELGGLLDRDVRTLDALKQLVALNDRLSRGRAVGPDKIATQPITRRVSVSGRAGPGKGEQTAKRASRLFWPIKPLLDNFFEARDSRAVEFQLLLERAAQGLDHIAFDLVPDSVRIDDLPAIMRASRCATPSRC
jgi:hypothetical protein